MKIVSLTASNVKRLSAVEITPEGSMVVITGKNGAGKSSVLDSIEYALRGKGSHCPQPIRLGRKKGYVIVDLGDIVVKRTFTKAGSQLTVESNGEVQVSPQTLLDRLVGALTFDPLAFTKMAPRDQASTLRGLVGLDTSQLDERRKELLEKRRDEKRDLQVAEACLTHVDAKGLPDEPIDTQALVEQMDAIAERNAALQFARDQRSNLKGDLDADAAELDGLKQRVAELGRQTKANEKMLADLDRQIGDRQMESVDEIKKQLSEAAEINKRIEVVRASLRQMDVVNAHRKRVSAITLEIERIDEEKVELLAAAEFPVDGLGFDEDGSVTFNDLPFEQSSSAEQLRVSLAMGLASNPELKIMLIRDGSLLDTDGMRLVGQMAEAADAQVWVERVEGDQPGAILIEDGAVAGAASAEEESDFEIMESQEQE